MSAQPSLVELFEQRSVEPLEPSAAVERLEPHAPRALNPFRKQEGDCCKCDATGVRIFWCHLCAKLYCWECHLKHKD